MLDVTLALHRYERLLVTSRVKECDSAVDALRRRQLLRDFDEQRSGEYSLTSLPDLAAIRVMAFPQQRLLDAGKALHSMLMGWTAEPVPGIEDFDPPLALKFFGKWTSNARITAEVQLVPLLIGLFWEIEHSAIYKPHPNLRGVARSEAVIRRRNDVFAALRAFETEFENAIRESAGSRETSV